MYEYRAPRRDMQFVLHEVLGLEAELARLGRADVDRATVDSVIEEGARFAEQVLSPLNWQGDWSGPRLEAGQVVTPPGFKAAYQQFCSDGWAGMSAETAIGGQGLPVGAHIAVGEMLCSSAMAWRMCSGLSEGAVRALAVHGSEELKLRFLGALVSGAHTGTMCLTEPQAGTDLGLMKCAAVPAGDGSYQVSGTKIYISWGEHDMAENILHLVLARLPDAPPGTRGISLFLVPKRLDGAANGVSCLSLEEKMGIHGSPTCVLAFERSRGWLIGAAHGGLACMFTMMNHARLGVALQGLGLSERSLQASLAYALERRQGRAPGSTHRDAAADPILLHPDVRRMLLIQRAFTEGQRLLIYHTYLLLDVEAHAADPAERAQASELVALLVPIVKAFLTDSALETTTLAIQVHGGAGYVRGTGVEQWLRDARIACIYEGTNGVQALDLIGRKVHGSGGRSVTLLIEQIRRTIAAPLPPALAAPAAELAALIEEWAALRTLILERARAAPAELAAAATDYLAFAGYVLLGWCWLRISRVAEPAATAGADRAFYEAKLAVARFYFARVLPRALSHAQAIRAGAASLVDPAALPLPA